MIADEMRHVIEPDGADTDAPVAFMLSAEGKPHLAVRIRRQLWIARRDRAFKAARLLFRIANFHLRALCRDGIEPMMSGGVIHPPFSSRMRMASHRPAM